MSAQRCCAGIPHWPLRLFLSIVFALAGGWCALTPAHAGPLAPRFTHLTTDHGLAHNIVWCIAQDRQGFLWFGTQGGLCRYDGYAFTTYRHRRSDPASLVNNVVCVDHAGVVWVGHSRGLDRLDPTSGRFTHDVHDPRNPHSISPGAVKVIVEDTARRALWIATEDPGTLNRLDRATGVFTRYEHDPADPHSLPQTYGIRAICLNPAGDPSAGSGPVLWLSTYNGLVHFDPQTRVFTTYRHDPTDPGSLSHDFVWCIYRDRAGALWIGTQAGLNRLDRVTGQFTVYTVEDGLPNDAVVAILGDEQGRLWLATVGGGLARFDPRTGAFRNYDVSDGLQSNQFIIGAYGQSQDGEIFLGGPNGFNAFFPAQVQDNPLRSPHRPDRVPPVRPGDDL